MLTVALSNKSIQVLEYITWYKIIHSPMKLKTFKNIKQTQYFTKNPIVDVTIRIPYNTPILICLTLFGRNPLIGGRFRYVWDDELLRQKLKMFDVLQEICVNPSR